jgi:hypothetical protein
VIRTEAAFAALWVEHHAGTHDTGFMSVEIVGATNKQVVYDLRGPEVGQVCVQKQSAPMAMATSSRKALSRWRCCVS